MTLGKLAQLPGPQRLGFMIGIAAAVALLVGAWIWSQTPDYRVLYASLSDRDGGGIITALQQMNVPYKFAEGGGALLVPGNRVHEVRLQLASRGLPKGGTAGFELMENQRLGSSQFLEQINYQRALEGELARSIQSLSAVQNARVHLALSKPSVFLREQQKPSASVLLNLFPGRSLDPSQVSAIVHLVSSSIPDLPLRNVTVVDQAGRLLSSPDHRAADAELDAGQLKFVQEIEQNYTARIEAILTPITGPRNVRAQVAADVDFARTERAEETYKPNQRAPEPAAVRSQQSTESVGGAAPGAGGVPGALSNQPPAPATAPITAPPAPAGGSATSPAGNAPSGAPVNSRKDTTVNYEVDKSITHVRQPVGSIRRLSVAVVVNYRKETDAAGKISHNPLPEAELAKINDLVREAMGFSKERGDTLRVVNSPFSVAEKEVIPEVPLWKQPGTIALAKETGKHLLIAAIVLYLLLGVLRPLLRNLAQARPAPMPAAEGTEGAAPGMLRAVGGAGYEENLNMARQLAAQEPKIVATVVKDWVSGDGR
jgi:flagellar M-ring protein FliF